MLLYVLRKLHPTMKLLRTLMRTVWTKQIIPAEWQRAVAVSIPKEKNSKIINQFRSIALLNVEARKMPTYRMENKYIDSSCQKVVSQVFQAAWNIPQ